MEQLRPKFKKNPYKSMETYIEGAFLRVPYGVMHIKDVWIYIHTNMDEYKYTNMIEYWVNGITRDDFELKPKYESLKEKKKLDVWNNFPNFCYEDEWVKYVIIQIHDKFMWLDMSHMITKQVIKVVTDLYSKGPIPILKAIKNEIVMKLTGVKFDKHALTVKDIDDSIVKYASMMIGYKIFYTNRENCIAATTIHTPH